MQRKLSILFIFLLLLCHTIQAQELTLYIIPPPKPINWKSPRAVVLSTIRNTLKKSDYDKSGKHVIGHIVVELKDSTRYALVGAVANSKRYMMHKVMHRGWGAGIFFAVISGKVEEADINKPKLEKRIETGSMAFVNYKINKAVFDRLWQYLQEYKTKGYDKYYNGLNKPRAGKGAGCSAYAHSFLEVGGLEHLINDSTWLVHVHVQEGLIGGPASDDRRVSIFQLLLCGKWANAKNKNYRELYYYEPSCMYDWVNREWSNHANEVIIPVNYGKAKGLTIDATYIIPPDEPIWHN